MSRVTFNVGGKLFETRQSTIKKIQDQGDLLNMLLRHTQPGEVIFIDREPQFFNDILRMYRNDGVYADPVKGKDTPEWMEALDYYGLKFLLPQSPELSVREEIEARLEQQRLDHKKLKANIENNWKDDAIIFLDCLNQHGGLCFVATYHTPYYPDSAKQIQHKGETFTMDWVISNRCQLHQYANSLGYTIQYHESHEDNRTDYDHPPASNLGNLTARKKHSVVVTLHYLV